jgi:hypothetical protein
MHAAVTTLLCILWFVLFALSSLLFGVNVINWNNNGPLNTPNQKQSQNRSVLGLLGIIVFSTLFLLTLSAGNSPGHLVPSDEAILAGLKSVSKKTVQLPRAPPVTIRKSPTITSPVLV